MPTLVPITTPEDNSSRTAVVVGPVIARAPGLADLPAALAKLQRGGRSEAAAAPHGAAVYLVIVPSPEPARGRPLDPPVTVLRPRMVKRAIDAMEADPAKPFTVVDLAAVAGVSVRSLQTAFRRYTGMTPMQYLRDVRLTRFHEDLLAADPRRVTVARIANRWGLTHLGRLAALYRARYGVSPSATLHSG